MAYKIKYKKWKKSDEAPYDKKKKYYAIIFNEWDKSMSKEKPVERYYEPETETLGMGGTIKWCKSKKEQSKMVTYGKTLGYKLDK